MDLLCKNLGGPCVRTVKLWRSESFFDVASGQLESNIEMLAAVLKDYNLLDVPGLWSEDATTCMKRVTAAMDGGRNNEGISVLVEGFVEPIAVGSIKATKLPDPTLPPTDTMMTRQCHEKDTPMTRGCHEHATSMT